jgi:hypothetical protein
MKGNQTICKVFSVPTQGVIKLNKTLFTYHFTHLNEGNPTNRLVSLALVR